VRTNELQYELPAELIAQHPADRRDASRLLVLDRQTGERRHEVFKRLPELLPADAFLVLNDTRVIPARLMLHRATGGRVEGLFLSEPAVGVWEVMVTGAGRLRAGEELEIDGTQRRLRMLERVDAGIWRAASVPDGDVLEILNECGRPPLPPYIKRKNPAADQIAEDIERYQTIYAREPGAVAAPTAGLHFTPEIFDALDGAGMPRVYVTLHVGVGTFTPIRCDELADHSMHAERYDCSEATAAAINDARADGRPIVAVGTTTVRVLESLAEEGGRISAGSGETRLFIYPPYRFRAVDAMVTNFHLPGSTLLAMIFGFAGRDAVLAAYEDAIEERYRFYSYGDAMLML